MKQTTMNTLESKPKQHATMGNNTALVLDLRAASGPEPYVKPYDDGDSPLTVNIEAQLCAFSTFSISI